MKPRVRVTQHSPTSIASRRPSRKAIALAVLLCAAIGAGVFFVANGSPPGGPTPAERAADVRVDADTSGAIQAWLLAVPDGFLDSFVDTQAALIARAAPEIRFHVVHSSDRGRILLLERIHALDPAAARRVTFHPARTSVSPWVRDYYLQARSRDGRQVAWLHNPEHYEGAVGPWKSIDPAEFVSVMPGLTPRQTKLRVDGGGLVADEERIFAARTPIHAALANGEARSPAQFEREVERAWGRPVTWFETGPAAPSGHCDVFLMPAGDRTVVMGNVGLGRSLLDRAAPQDKRRFTERFRELTRTAPDPSAPAIQHERILSELSQDSALPSRVAALDAIDRQITHLGYKVVRVPYLALEPTRYGLYFTITYTNVVIDVRDGRRTVFVPAYGLGTLDKAGTTAWKGLGYEVVPIDTLGPAIHGGAVRCLSQVMRR